MEEGKDCKDAAICDLPDSEQNVCTSADKRKYSLISETIWKLCKLYPKFGQGTEPGSVLAGAIVGLSSTENIHQIINRLQLFLFFFFFDFFVFFFFVVFFFLLAWCRSAGRIM